MIFLTRKVLFLFFRDLSLIVVPGGWEQRGVRFMARHTSGMLAGPGAYRIASLWATSDLPVVSFMMTRWLTGHWLRTRGKPAPADLFGWTSDPQKRICFAQNALETSWIERRWFLHRSCTPVLFLSPEKMFSDIDQNSFQIFRTFLDFSNDFWNFSIFEQFYVFMFFFQVCFWQLRKKLEFRCRIVWAFDLWGSPPYLCPTNACSGVSTRGFDFELFQNDVFYDFCNFSWFWYRIWIKFEPSSYYSPIIYTWT